MSQNKSFSRYDILSLDVKTVRNFIRTEKQTKLALSEDGVDFPGFDPSVRSWVLSIPNNISVTRQKIGKSLLKQHQNGFQLNDPHMYQSRFCVEYHRMQDPALKQYFKSAPVRQRLECLGVITKQDNVLCSTKEFAEYLRYLEGLHSLEIAGEIKNTKKKRLTNNLQKWVDTQRYESQFTGIFRRKKFQHEQKSKTTLTGDRKTISSKQSSLDLYRAVVRADKIKEERRNQFKEKNQKKKDKFNTNKLMIIQMEHKRKTEADDKIKNKLDEAQQLKKRLQDEKLINKFTDGIDSFKKHWILRKEIGMKNIELYQLHEEEKRKNMERRIKKIEQTREKDESKKIKLRREIARKERCNVIAEKVAKQAKILSGKYLKLIDQKNFEEISRRFSMLTEPFIAECLKKITSVLQDLKIPVSSATLVETLLATMIQLIVIIPKIGPSKCVLVRERVAGFISNIIIQIKNDRLKHIRDNWIKRKRASEYDVSTADEKDLTSSKHVSVDDYAHVIGESSFSFDEFIGHLKSVKESEIEKTYNLSKVINIHVNKFFETISKVELHFSEKLNDRDFIHLYNFQKYYIHRSIRRITELVKVKQYHYWNVKREIETWQKLNLNLMDLSYEMIDLIMKIPSKTEDYCTIIRKISKYICIQLSQDLDKENITDARVEDSSSEYSQSDSEL